MASPNVMSVELAIQRELAYRRRMEALQFGLHGASSGATNPFQDPLLPSTSGTKRKSPYMDAPIFPPRQQLPRPNATYRHANANLSCTLCMESFPNTYYLDRHCEGTKHKTKIAKNRVSHVNVSNPFMCEICQVTSSSRITLEQHLLGRRHKQNADARPAPSMPREPQFDIANLTWESV
uniref:C2H2-type domain-containing protein n=1 Tax=Kalanchoe fedtschenkoi TaxID=63787 RepID=A0A7N1A1P4_KALFE